jgi:hypothetical protein
VHAPAWQVSTCVQAFPSLHAVPSGFGDGGLQSPETGSHVGALLQASPAPHKTGSLPWHTPAMQVSVCVHAVPSLQAVPSGRGGFEQRPVAESHTPLAWQSSVGAQTTPAHGSGAGE